jgi:hypothetical protein
MNIFDRAIIWFGNTIVRPIADWIRYGGKK